MLPINDILAVVREPKDPIMAFEALRDIGKAALKSPVWRSISAPDVERDILLAGAWLTENIAPDRPQGIYLGLDTLNERDGSGKNVEIGMTGEADPASTTFEWAWHCERYGESHLIEGMYEVHRQYQDYGLDYKAGQLADYVFFLGYGGIVLVSALERIPVRWNSIFVWGFHDGDLGLLAKASLRGVTRLATIDGA